MAIHNHSNLRNVLTLVSLNIVLICGFMLVADFVLGWMRPGAAQVGPVATRDIPTESPPNNFAIYNAFSWRGVPLREWPIGSVVRKSTAPATEFAGHVFPRDYYDLKIDQEGFVAPSRIHDEPELKIVFLGGSTTENHLMDPEERFPFLAGRAIEKSTGMSTNSYNAGVAGNTSLHALTLFIYKVLSLRPSYAVMMEAVNDLSVLAHFGTYDVDGPRAVVTTHLQENSNFKRADLVVNGIKHLARGVFPNLYAALSEIKARFGSAETHAAVADEFANARARGAQPPSDDDIIARYTANLVSFIEVARAHGVRPILMTQVNRLTTSPDFAIRRGFERFPPPMPYERYAGVYRRMNEAVRSIAQARGVLLIDLDFSIEKDSENFYDAVHLTAAGSRRAAGLIAQAIIDDIGANPLPR